MAFAISTAVTMLVLTPHVMWTLTQSYFCLTPYLWSNHRMNREVANPDESIAKSTSTDFRGRLDSPINALRIGVSPAISRYLKTVL